jgi:glutathione S-transferase
MAPISLEPTSALLKDSTHVTGEHFSVADITLLATVDFAAAGLWRRWTAPSADPRLRVRGSLIVAR